MNGNRSFRLVVAGSVIVGLESSASNAAAASLNLKKTSAGDGALRSRIVAARNGGICCALVTKTLERPGVAFIRSSFVFTALRLVQQGGVISVKVNIDDGL